MLFTWGRDRHKTVAPILSRLEEMAQELKSVQEEEHQRRKGQLVIALVILVVSVATSFIIFNHSGTAPAIAEPGVIAIAETGSGSVPIDITARFDGQSHGSTKAVLAITSGGSPGSRAEVIVIVCGDLQNGLSISDRNSGPLPLKPLPGSPGDFDSQLGDHARCSFVTVSPFAFQVVLIFNSPQALASIADERILYALPGITTLLPHTPLGKLDARPWPTGTTVNVRLTRAPQDFSLDAAIPSIQEGGLLSWDYVAGAKGSPLEYRISGVLLDRQDEAQNRTFVAGVIAGVAGAALIWAVDLSAAIFLPRRKSRRSSSTA
ncbi:hypothetical protein [Agreia sp. Leaf283]|uniref:hypothetical protein n=1 Tax=Agreia sp. Leaf283 TaxID=1736321 RepID=UPI0012F95FB0|nr:hypothetical protein [Agreia sp. Leaf283]